MVVHEPFAVVVEHLKFKIPGFLIAKLLFFTSSEVTCQVLEWLESHRQEDEALEVSWRKA